jgi:hypothetical protein
MVEMPGVRALAETPTGARNARRQRPEQNVAETATAIEAVRRQEREDPARKLQAARTPRPPSKFVCQRRRKSIWLRA